MKILITNDDGINAPGIIKLAETAKRFGEVTVVAPKEQCSAMSHHITLREDIAFSEYDFPVDGVKAYAFSGFLNTKPFKEKRDVVSKRRVSVCIPLILRESLKVLS